MPQTKLYSAKVYKAPLFKVVESWGFLQVKPRSLMTAGDIKDRVDDILTTQSKYILVGEDTYSLDSLPAFIRSLYYFNLKPTVGSNRSTITVSQIKAYIFKGVVKTRLTT